MLTVIILAAGQGKRMCSKLPKVLHTLGGRPMLAHVVATAYELSKTIHIVASPYLDDRSVQQWNPSWYIQEKPLGTGDAVKVALPQDLSGDVLIVCGDAPLVQIETLKAIIDQYQKLPQPCLAVVGMRALLPNQYGRIVLDQSGIVKEIIEDKHATAEQREQCFANSGVLLGPASLLASLVRKLKSNAVTNEYYLTDCVMIARQQGINTYLLEGVAEEFCGINTKIELANAEETLQNRWRRYWMEHGVTLRDPKNTFFAFDTVLSEDVTIEPFVTLKRGVKIHSGASILSFCCIEDSEIGQDAVIGPFAHLRGGNRLEEKVQIGNFVEVKKSHFAAGAKAKHLSYLGDTRLGKNVNIGAGTISCNYDGFNKFETVIGDNVLVGSNSALVAPVQIEDDAIIAAGSVICKDVPAESLAIARKHQENKPGWAKIFREKNKKY